jgi:uncharacterized protein YceK
MFRKTMFVVVLFAMFVMAGCNNVQSTIAEYNNSADYEYTITYVMVPNGQVRYEWSLKAGSRQERRLHMLRFSAEGKNASLKEAQQMIDASLKRWRDSETPMTPIKRP